MHVVNLAYLRNTYTGLPDKHLMLTAQRLLWTFITEPQRLVMLVLARYWSVVLTYNVMCSVW